MMVIYVDLHLNVVSDPCKFTYPCLLPRIHEDEGIDRCIVDLLHLRNIHEIEC